MDVLKFKWIWRGGNLFCKFVLCVQSSIILWPACFNTEAPGSRRGYTDGQLIFWSERCKCFRCFPKSLTDCYNAQFNFCYLNLYTMSCNSATVLLGFVVVHLVFQCLFSSDKCGIWKISVFSLSQLLAQLCECGLRRIWVAK